MKIKYSSYVNSVINFGLFIVIFIGMVASIYLVNKFRVSKRIDKFNDFNIEAAKIIKENAKTECTDEEINDICQIINPFKLQYNFKDAMIDSGISLVLYTIMFMFIGFGSFANSLGLAILIVFYSLISIGLYNIIVPLIQSHNTKGLIGSFYLKKSDLINDKTIKELSKMEGFNAYTITKA